MDPITQFALPGFLGGLVIAMFFHRVRRSGESPDVFAGERLSTDAINIAHIRVAGVGGLGLVAMALVVALVVPGIGEPLLIGAVLGAMLAAVLIVARRRQGAMPSSGRRFLGPPR
jgi:peptidoglycan/LPS O-acetylase OafA/YrhL